MSKILCAHGFSTQALRIELTHPAHSQKKRAYSEELVGDFVCVNTLCFFELIQLNTLELIRLNTLCEHALFFDEYAQ